ncbi:MAG: methionine adenosyltransferase [Alphaproteobacteria bacterium]|nr:methionine adenosyltransferase [Alphaproteobacteria bacterium]
MSDQRYIFTSESVGEGHPDKVCDRVSDAIVDAYLNADPQARCAVECMATTGYLCIAGETRGPSSITTDMIETIARHAIRDIGYKQEEFHWEKIKIDVKLHAQSADIAAGVDAGDDKDEGAGDQGIMFGYACRETEVFMPAALHYSHAILKSLAEARHSGALHKLGPDAKSQVSLEYVDGKPVRATSIVVSTQHDGDLTQEQVREMVRPHVVNILPEGWMCDEDKFYVNPTGRFVIGGPDGDCGLTGRKIIVDTYGGAAPHGGGAFSGKDPTKVDRSAAYAARHAAKNIVAAGLADTCTIQLSYAIGISHPISIYVNTHGTGAYDDAALSQALQAVADFRPRAIRERLGLNKPIYARTAAYGHFGRTPEADGGFTWEKLDLVDALKNELSSGKYNDAERSDNVRIADFSSK